MLMNLASLPNVIAVDMANMVVAHAKNWGYDVFQPFQGRVAKCSAENIQKAQNGKLKVDWHWITTTSNVSSQATTVRSDCEQLLCNPTTGSTEHYCLFNPFHEKNSTNPADCLRRVSCVNQLAGKINMDTAEQQAKP